MHAKPLMGNQDYETTQQQQDAQNFIQGDWITSRSRHEVRPRLIPSDWSQTTNKQTKNNKTMVVPFSVKFVSGAMAVQYHDHNTHKNDSTSTGKNIRTGRKYFPIIKTNMTRFAKK
eukprot:CAMPEP_0116556800 /NCGR_PEP_ID=MMETSP0397-20121206/8893_1 /TAXON_ID=216820 /ORGANISM="Cyclophora tenuis, Strain ECT3854" /LENGTH=115 /DNA_ID=CAMNT_0004082201 /DNA_START=438 /DNA_END=785 /DNA_ORIENTATION=-